MDTRALVGGAAALGLCAGLGLGYALFHSSSKATPAATPAAATSSASSSAADFTLTGKLTLKWSRGAFVRDESGACAGSGGYSDISSGAAVTIADQTGTVIATGQLGDGHADVSDAGSPIDCVFSFTVPNVPDGKTFYGVTVSHRGAIQFSADRAKGGDVALSIGGS
jgi:hypothetical protein